MDETGKEEIVRLTGEYGGDWGLNHTCRLLRLVESIGEGLEYDHDVVWIAAYLHDWGGYSPWMRPGIDHASRSGEVAREYLQQRGYPEERIQTVVNCIVTHHYDGHHQGGPDRPVEAVLLSDADALDFLGVVGVLRDFSKKPKALREAFETVQKRMARLPGQLCLEKSRQIALSRIEEMKVLLQSFEEESFGCF